MGRRPKAFAVDSMTDSLSSPTPVTADSSSSESQSYNLRKRGPGRPHDSCEGRVRSRVSTGRPRGRPRKSTFPATEESGGSAHRTHASGSRKRKLVNSSTDGQFDTSAPPARAKPELGFSFYEDDVTDKSSVSQDSLPHSPASTISTCPVTPPENLDAPHSHMYIPSSKLELFDDMDYLTDSSSVDDDSDGIALLDDNTLVPVEAHLKSAFLHERENLSSNSWLTATMIDLLLYRFATIYTSVHFLPVEFSALHLPSAQRNFTLDPHFSVRDILGRTLRYDSRPVVFAVNIGNRHWNLIRIRHYPAPELELFEPLGKPAARHSAGYVSLRYIPQAVIEWLDCCWPLAGTSWLRRSVSAITNRHQLTTFDCGVACLLYAEKCGQGQGRHEINETTDQEAITVMRHRLQEHIERCFESESEPLVEDEVKVEAEGENLPSEQEVVTAEV